MGCYSCDNGGGGGGDVAEVSEILATEALYLNFKFRCDSIPIAIPLFNNRTRSIGPVSEGLRAALRQRDCGISMNIF